MSNASHSFSECINRLLPHQHRDSFWLLRRYMIHVPGRLIVSSDSDLGLVSKASFTFGDISVFEALNQAIDIFGLEILAPFRELKVLALLRFCFVLRCRRCFTMLIEAEVLRPDQHTATRAHVPGPPPGPRAVVATFAALAYSGFWVHHRSAFIRVQLIKHVLQDLFRQFFELIGQTRKVLYVL